MFLSATLLFLVEPMIAKMALPLVGGTPAVWNTCIVFFQAALLGGNLYAYATTRWLKHTAQIVLHISLVLLAFLVLPIHIPSGWEPPTQSSPILWILAMLSMTVALPFLLLAASTSIVQRWFTQSNDPSASDPYFLYAASNAGSIIGLLGYPLMFEATFRLSAQSHLWSVGFFLFLAMTVLCASLVWRQENGATSIEAIAPEAAPDLVDKDLWRQRVRWIALAFVPSSLMLGVTTVMTTDVPALPLFWVLPLVAYLLSFVLAFAKRPIVTVPWIMERLPFVILILLFPSVSKLKFPLTVLLLIYLTGLFAIALACHTELAVNRPRASRLTEFFLLISVGGVLGGIFNALIAPMVFSTVLEFPLVLIFAALLRTPANPKINTPAKVSRAKHMDWVLPLALGTVMLCVLAVLGHFRVEPSAPATILFVGYSMLWCMSFGRRRNRFALGLVVVLAVCSSAKLLSPDQSLHSERSFFGVLRVSNDPTGRFRKLFHGAIVHGEQSLERTRALVPIAYYSESGPAGSILGAMHAKPDGLRTRQWAVIGLGAGAMACYLQPGDSLTFYELNPSVKQIASDPRYFTYLSGCAPSARVVLGDARLRLREAADDQYDLIVLDAFSGDSIPLHLMTREALALYLRKLTPGGIIAFHISNLYLELSPTLGALAADAGLVCLFSEDLTLSPDELNRGKLPSKWLVMARRTEDLGLLAKDPHWIPVATKPGTRIWTDDYSNLWRVIKWN